MAVETGYYWEYPDKTQIVHIDRPETLGVRFGTKPDLVGRPVCYMAMRVCHARKVRFNPYLCTYYYCCVRGTQIVYEPLSHKRYAAKVTKAAPHFE